MSLFSKLIPDAPKALKIIIVGTGKVGSTLAEILTAEGNDVTIIDPNPEVIEDITTLLDVRGIVGNGSSYSTLIEAGIEDANLIIAVTNSDELNLLCCTLAKKVGNCSSIARVRNPDYHDELNYLRDRLGISMIINPELEAAKEIARILHFPSAISVNSFAKGSVDMIKFRIPKGNVLAGMNLSDLQYKKDFNLLVCVVERANQLIIPNGNFRLRADDVVSFISSPKDAYTFFKKIKLECRRINSAMIIGGGKTSFYLAKDLVHSGISVKIIESSAERCAQLSQLLPNSVVIVNGNGGDEALLKQENIQQTGAFIPLTGLDEENILLSLYAMHTAPETKAVTKVNHINFANVITSLSLGSVVYPRHLTAEMILTYVRAKMNSIDSNIETLYRLFDDRVEGIEFKIDAASPYIGIPLKRMHLKDNLLIACISRRGRALIPGGDDYFMADDAVIIVTTHSGFDNIEDIFAR